MPSKLQTYMQMADEAQRQITGSYRGWTGFLTTAARLYKYPYAEQVMIHAQRPDATACAEYDFWNEKMGRYVRRGSKGIALIDSSGERPRLRYVFDVSDTGGREFPKSRYLWEYREEHADAVSAMLESRYGVDGKGGLPDQLERIASQLAEEYWRDYKRDILAIVDDSFLYGYDEFNVGAAFQSAAAVSIAYSLMSRCGLEADDRFEHEDFLSIFDFNTPEAAAELGTAVSRMVCGIIITIYTLLLLVASLLYVKKRYSIEKGALTRTAFKAHWVLLAITAAVLLLFVTLSIQYSLRNELLKLPVLMRWTTLLWGLYLLAYIDYRERLIPNFLICVLLIARVAFLGCNLISDPEYWRSILLYPLIGAGIGGVILAVAMLLSRKGVGMGDVKLFITIGAYVGSMEIIATLFYTFVVSAVVGIVLLLMKKVKLRDSVPMAPFAFAGVAIEYAFMLIGG